MSTTWQVILAGSGGQGLGLAGQVLAEAALASGMHAAHNQSYGARARGGYSQSSVILSPHEVIFPFVEEPNLVIALSQKAYDLNLPLLAPGGLLLYDSSLVQRSRESSLIGFPFDETARETGNPLGIALVALGTAAGLTGLVPEDTLQEALARHFRGAALEANRRCLALGLELKLTTLPSESGDGNQNTSRRRPDR